MTVTPHTLFSITPGSSAPIYRQLVEQVRRRVAAGQLAPGDDLPSVREVAQALALNPMTVSKAYSLLEAEGVLERRRGLGMTVARGAAAKKGPAGRAELLRPTLERAAAEARELGLEPEAAVALFAKILGGKS
jgi:GntR family transcriptional regulator